MNWAWWDGKMTLHHYREEHGLDSKVISERSAETAGELGTIDGAAPQEPEVTGTKHGH